MNLYSHFINFGKYSCSIFHSEPRVNPTRVSITNIYQNWSVNGFWKGFGNGLGMTELSSPAVWREEIRELTLLPIRMQKSNSLIFLIIPPIPLLFHMTSLVTSLSAKKALCCSEKELEIKDRETEDKRREIAKEMMEWRQ